MSLSSPIVNGTIAIGSVCFLRDGLQHKLLRLGRYSALAEGWSILVHAAAGGLGQVAIQTAERIRAEIFVTVGMAAKCKLTMEQYNIPDDPICSSHDVSFHTGGMRMTICKGVDAALSSLASELLRLTWMCIADLGRFIEVGKRDIIEKTGLETSPLYRKAMFASVNVDNLEQHSRPAYARSMQKKFDLLRAGLVSAVHPIAHPIL